MLSVAEAQARVTQDLPVTGQEWVPLNAALGRVLARDIEARRDQPPAAVSAMDGFAVRADDCATGQTLDCIAEVPAGQLPPSPIGAGQAMRVFTGALLPAGTDAILIQENAAFDGRTVTVNEPPKAGQFIRRRGLDFSMGDIGLRASTKLDPRAIGLAAAFGHAVLPVRQRPRVGLLATGDELTRPGEPGTAASIFSSNTPALMAMITAWGGEAVELGIAKDTAESLLEHLTGAGNFDILVTSGGASVGDYDLIKPVLGKAGLSLDFWKIAMRPGKPLIFGTYNDAKFLGLPGNPVSASVCAIMFLRPMIRTFLGLPATMVIRTGRLGRALPANDQRQDYLRAAICDDGNGLVTVNPAPKQDSSMFNTFAQAQALAIRPPHDPAKDVDESIDFIMLEDVLQS